MSRRMSSDTFEVTLSRELENLRKRLLDEYWCQIALIETKPKETRAPTDDRAGPAAHSEPIPERSSHKGSSGSTICAADTQRDEVEELRTDECHDHDNQQPAAATTQSSDEVVMTAILRFNAEEDPEASGEQLNTAPQPRGPDPRSLQRQATRPDEEPPRISLPGVMSSPAQCAGSSMQAAEPSGVESAPTIHSVRSSVESTTGNARTSLEQADVPSASSSTEPGVTPQATEPSSASQPPRAPGRGTLTRPIRGTLPHIRASFDKAPHHQDESDITEIPEADSEDEDDDEGCYSMYGADFRAAAGMEKMIKKGSHDKGSYHAKDSLCSAYSASSAPPEPKGRRTMFNSKHVTHDDSDDEGEDSEVLGELRQAPRSDTPNRGLRWANSALVGKTESGDEERVRRKSSPGFGDGQHFEVEESWMQSHEASRVTLMRRQQSFATGNLLAPSTTQSMISSKPRPSSSQDARSSEISTVKARASMKEWMISPSSGKHLVVEIMGLVFLLYECIFIPLMVFDTPQTTTQTALEWIVRLFWSMNLVLSCITGFHRDDGTVEMSPTKVMLRYAVTYGPVDMAMVAIDWAEVFVTAVSTQGRSSQSLILRYMLMVRLVRVIRVFTSPEISEELYEYVQSEEVRLWARIGRIIVFLILVAHIIACLWFGIGKRSGRVEASWIEQYDYWDHTWLQQYSVCLYWSMAQFAGEQLLIPVNLPERWFAIATLLFGLVVSSTFVGSLTTSMTRIQFLTSQQSSQLWMLRRFLSANSITRPLAVRVQQNAQHAMIEQKRNLSEDQVALLHVISNPLMVELHFEINWKILAVHPFFEYYVDVNPGGIRKVCHTAVSMLTLSEGDILFSNLEVDPLRRMFFVVSGILSYEHVNHTRKVNAGSWLCEPCVWTNTWTHCGTAKAETMVRMLVVDAVTFQSVLSTFPTEHCKLYAEMFVGALNQLEQGNLTDVETCSKRLDKMVANVFDLECDTDDEEEDSTQDIVSKFAHVVHGAAAGPTEEGHGPESKNRLPSTASNANSLYRRLAPGSVMSTVSTSLRSARDIDTSDKTIPITQRISNLFVGSGTRMSKAGKRKQPSRRNSNGSKGKRNSSGTGNGTELKLPRGASTGSLVGKEKSGKGVMNRGSMGDLLGAVPHKENSMSSAPGDS